MCSPQTGSPKIWYVGGIDSMKDMRYTISVRITECSSTRRFPAVKSRFFTLFPKFAIFPYRMHFVDGTRSQASLNLFRTHDLLERAFAFSKISGDA